MYTSEEFERERMIKRESLRELNRYKPADAETPDLPSDEPLADEDNDKKLAIAIEPMETELGNGDDHGEQ